jgi:magnesium transporter
MEYENHVFLNARAIHQVPGDGSELTELAAVLGQHYVLTAHRDPLGLIERTLERVQGNAGHVRELGPAHLFYLLLDGLVDDYFEWVDALSETVDDIDARAGEPYDRHLSGDIAAGKRRVLTLHRAISPLRDALLNLRRTDHKFISDHTAVYIRDAFEHLLQLLETVETYREVLSSTTELMMSAASNRMNEVITALTLITSLFIPITFIAGFYGMNLMMPEFRSPIAYPIVIGVMVLTVAGMFIWFRRKKWL